MEISFSLPSFLATNASQYDTVDTHNLWCDLLYERNNVISNPTIALAPSMGTVLHFNHATPCSDKSFANFLRYWLQWWLCQQECKVDDRPKDRRFPSVPCQESEHMQPVELANVTGNHCQDQSFHRIESRSKAHHEDWLKALFAMIQPLAHVGPQPADISMWRQNVCNLLLYLTTKHIFESFGWCSCPVAPLVVGLAAHPLCMEYRTMAVLLLRSQPVEQPE